tara:strand:- start:176 stop:340 length:165 start_codon:yes stop_codon:yes gene_type:complete
MTKNKNAIINHSREINTLYSIVDKLEKRIATLERVVKSQSKTPAIDPFTNWTTK